MTKKASSQMYGSIRVSFVSTRPISSATAQQSKSITGLGPVMGSGLSGDDHNILPIPQVTPISSLSDA